MADGWALVTGATRGIGRALVRRLRADGYRIVATGRAAAELSELAAELGDDGTVVPADLANPEQVTHLAETVAADHRPLRVVVNNAATVDHRPFADTTPELWEQTLRVNLLSPIELVRLLEPVLEAPASVVNVGSIVGTLPSRSASPYIVAKGGLHHATRALALELAAHGVRVNAVAPGFIATEMFSESRDEASRRRIAAVHPLGRAGDVDEVAAAVSFLCSPDASFITGVVLPVDGGLACQMSVPNLGDA